MISPSPFLEVAVPWDYRMPTALRSNRSWQDHICVDGYNYIYIYTQRSFVCESTSRSREAIRAKKHSVKYACQNSRPATDHIGNLVHSSCDWGEPGAALLDPGSENQ